MKKQKILIILGTLGLYLVSTGISYALFSYFKKSDESGITPFEEEIESGIPTEEKVLIKTEGLPKDQVCPLNGELFTKPEKEAWEKRRPLTVMVENHEEARPQSGLSTADITYEAVAEGGITRFLAVFYCDAQDKESIVGPVRSARTYFLDWASEYGKFPLYAHVGGANCNLQTGSGCLNGAPADALSQIREYGWALENDLDEFSLGYPTFWRDYERIGHTVATEHTMYSTTERLWAVAKKRDWTNKNPDGEDWQENFVLWPQEGQKEEKGQKGEKIVLNFWSGYKAYEITWEYNSQTDDYARSQLAKPFKDLNNDQQIKAKNVIVQFTKESQANDGYEGNIRLLYGTVSEGKAIVFKHGKAIVGKWEKESRTGRTLFYDEAGSQIRLNPGKIWIAIVPIGQEVSF